MRIGGFIYLLVAGSAGSDWAAEALGSLGTTEQAQCSESEAEVAAQTEDEVALVQIKLKLSKDRVRREVPHCTKMAPKNLCSHVPRMKGVRIVGPAALDGSGLDGTGVTADRDCNGYYEYTFEGTRNYCRNAARTASRCDSSDFFGRTETCPNKYYDPMLAPAAPIYSRSHNALVSDVPGTQFVEDAIPFREDGDLYQHLAKVSRHRVRWAPGSLKVPPGNSPLKWPDRKMPGVDLTFIEARCGETGFRNGVHHLGGTWKYPRFSDRRQEDGTWKQGQTQNEIVRQFYYNCFLATRPDIVPDGVEATQSIFFGSVPDVLQCLIGQSAPGESETTEQDVTLKQQVALDMYEDLSRCPFDDENVDAAKAVQTGLIKKLFKRGEVASEDIAEFQNLRADQWRDQGEGLSNPGVENEYCALWRKDPDQNNFQGYGVQWFNYRWEQWADICLNTEDPPLVLRGWS